MVRGYSFNSYYILQPGGATLEVPAGAAARVVYPNWLKAPPNAQYLLTEYRPKLGYEGWVGIGEAAVDADGKRILPSARTESLTAFNGAGIVTGPPPPPQTCGWFGCVPDDGPPGCCTFGDAPSGAGTAGAGDPASVTTGIFSRSETEVFLPDTYPIKLGRTHVAGDTIERPFGFATSHNWEIYLWRADINVWTEANIIMANGVRVNCPRTSPGTGETGLILVCQGAPGPYFGAVMQWNPVLDKMEMVLKDGTLYRFGKFGIKIHAVRDPNGNQISVIRNPVDTGNVEKLISPNGRTLSFVYTGNHITQLKDNDGRTWNYSYDPQGRLASATDPDGKVREYTYESATSHRMATYKDPRLNIAFTNLYWPDGRLKKQTLIDAAIFQFAYTIDGQGRVTQTDVTDQRSNVRRVQMNTQGFITSDTFAFGTALAQTHSFTYQPGTNLRLTTTDGLNRTRAYTYDGFANVATATLMSGTGSATTTTFTYEPARQQLARITDALSHATNFGYDFKGNLTSIKDARNQSTTMGYDEQGRMSSVTDPLTHATTMTYRWGDLATVTDAVSRTTNVFIDTLGRPTVTRDPLGNKTLTAYDVRDRPTLITDPLGGTVQLGYDANNNLLSHRDPKNNLTEFTYDTMNRLKTRKDALLRTESYDYDIAGRLKQITDRKAQVSGFGYDALNRRTSAGFGATTGSPLAFTSTIAYTYDAGNRLTQAVDSIAGTITRQYDPRFDTLTQEVTPLGAGTYTFDYQYDAAGRRSQMQGVGQTAVSYGYDDANRLTSVTQGSNAVSFTYDAASRRTVATLPNSVSIDYGYDNANQLTSITHKLSGATLQALAYGYDTAGRRITMSGSAARVNLPPSLASATYDANNRLAAWNGAAQSYDFNGNLTNDGVQSYTWDSRDRLSALSGSTPVSFSYDAFNRRTFKTAGTTQIGTLYDGFSEVNNFSDTSSTSTLLNGLGLDERYASTQGGVTLSFLPDALGSTLNLVSPGGAMTAQFTYEPYGTATQSGTDNTAFRFTGREEDGTGLMYYRGRYYFPRISRFISEDPIGLAGGYNLYAYVGGNPIGATDPLGLAWVSFQAHDRTANAWDVVVNGADPGHAWITVVNDDGTKAVVGNYPGGFLDDSWRKPDASTRAWWVPQEIADSTAVRLNVE